MIDLNLHSILLWRVFATGLLTLVMSASQELGWSRISLPFIIGTIFSPRRDLALVGGFVVHIIFGCVFALLYGLVFESWGRAVWWQGALLGLYHGLFVLVALLPILPAVHPRMAGRHHGPSPTRQLEPPGFLALHYGRRTPMITLAAHMLYGSILGTFYQVAG